MGKAMIAQRLQAASGLTGKFAVLPKSELSQRLRRLAPFFAADHIHEYGPPLTFDAREVLPRDIARWLGLHELPNEIVAVMWLSEHEGISMLLSDFLLHIDELWYPSSDDVIVESSSGSFVITIDHEEQARLFRQRSVPPLSGK
jgi:hypothetical protein